MKAPQASQRFSDYDPRSFWSSVAREIGARGVHNRLAGDDTPFFDYKREVFLSRFLHTLPAAGRDILEVGSGPGGNLAEVAKALPRRLVGADISPAMIELAKQNTRDIPAIEFQLVDGTRLPFLDREFDTVFTVTVLQHNHEPLWSTAIKEICRVAKESVYLFEDTAVSNRATYSLSLRPVGEYVAQCAALGFELVSAEPLGIYVSDRVTAAVRKVATSSRHSAGKPLPKAAVMSERLALRVTKILDHVVPQRRGLTRMIFRRVRTTV